VRLRYPLLASLLLASGAVAMLVYESAWGILLVFFGAIVLFAWLRGGRGESLFSWADKENALIDFWRVHGRGGS
jgi:hypothetical protein